VGAGQKLNLARAGLALRKFCMKFLDPFSSVREYIAQSLAPPTAAEEYCAVAALERPT
jgi:hypothetical protein